MFKAKGKDFRALFFCLNLHCCLCPPDSVSRNGTKRKQTASGRRSGPVAKRSEVKRSRTGRTQAFNFELQRQSAVFSRFRRNQRQSPVRKTAVCRRSNQAFAHSTWRNRAFGAVKTTPHRRTTTCCFIAPEISVKMISSLVPCCDGFVLFQSIFFSDECRQPRYFIGRHVGPEGGTLSGERP